MFGTTSLARLAATNSGVLLICLMFGVGAAGADEIGTYKDWSAFRDGTRERVCYMGSVPKKEEGKYTRRDDTYVLITHRPGDKTFDVVSVTAGYEYQKNSEVEVKIDDQSFAMFTQGNNAWARSANIDQDLVNAMRRGQRMIVRGTSARGTVTTDTYSLSGFTAAHSAIDKACPKG